VPQIRHSANLGSLPSVGCAALGEPWFFAECQAAGTRRSFLLFRVPFRLALGETVVTVTARGDFAEYGLALGESFSECPRKGTRQSRLRRH